MSSLVVDDRTLATLKLAKGVTEICNANGEVIGFFAPAVPSSGPTGVDAADAGTPADNAPSGNAVGENRTTRQVFEHLKSLTPDPAMRDYLQKHVDVLAERDRCDSP